MYEAIGRRWIDRLHDLANLVDVNLVWKLCPEDDARGREVAPDSPRGFHAGELGHLDVEYTDVGLLSERDFHGLFAVASLENRDVRRKFLFENLTQVMTLGHVIFSNQD